MSKTTKEVVAERPYWLTEKLDETIRARRTTILLALCGMRPCGMAMNQAELFVTLAEEGLERERQRVEAIKEMSRLNHDNPVVQEWVAANTPST